MNAARSWMSKGTKRKAVGIAAKLGTTFVKRVAKNAVRNVASVLSGQKRWSVKRGVFGRTKKNREVVASAAPQLSGGMSQNYLGAKKKKMPRWFKQILHETKPGVLVGKYEGAMVSAAMRKECFVLFKHLDINAIQAAWKAQASAYTSSVSGADALSQDVYLYNVVREHIFRNGTTGNVEIEFYHLTPRRDVAIYSVDTSSTTQLLPTVCPAPTNNASGGFLQAPGGWTQPFTDMLVEGIGTKVLYNDPTVTPYMNPLYTSMFKIKPLKVTFPSGQKGHKGVLEPGHGITLTCSRLKPFLANYNKFGLTGEHPFNLDHLYQLIRETPLIMVFVRGGVAHDHTTPTNVGIGPAKIDYWCNMRFEECSQQAVQKATGQYTTEPTAITGAEEVLQPTAADTTITTT